MPPLTLGQAAKATGKSKSTLTRAIKAGRLSAQKGEDGSYAIDPAELSRVYEVQPSATVAQPSERDTMPPPDATPVAVLQERLRAAEDALARERETVDDLRARLDRAEDRITALLPPPQVADRDSS